MADSDNQRTIGVNDAARVEALARAFADAWRGGAPPRLEDFLDRVEGSLQAAALRELLDVEIQQRLKRDEAVSPDEYLERFSDFENEVRDACRETQVIVNDATVVLPARGGALQVRCPSCSSSVDLAPDAEFESIRCDSCGSQFSLTTESSGSEAQFIGQLGHFRLLDRLGMGAFGSVWRAQDEELDRIVAVKIPRAGQLDKQGQEFFLREARSAAQLRHPNIVPVYEVGREGDRLYIVSEFVRGTPLSDRNSAGLPTFRDAAELCAKIAIALDHAHDAGIIHRDLKPANVMIDDRGEPRLMDFGLARREAGEVTMTLEGQVLGTPAYMSPEQAKGAAHDADRRSDVYSLGVMLFEMLTGELPFRGNLRLLIHQVINEEAPTPRKFNPATPRDLETITLKCLAKRPESRYQTAAEVAEELRRFLRGEPIVARPVGSVERTWRWCRRNPLVASLTATAAGLLAGVALVATVGYVQTSRALVQKAEAAETSNQVSKFLENLFITSTPLRSSDDEGFFVSMRDPTDANLTARQILDRGAENIKNQLGDQPRVQARLLATMGSAYHGLGQFDKATEMFRAALEIEENLQPRDPVAIASAIHRLGSALGYAGDYPQAEELARKSLKVIDEAGEEGRMPATAIRESLGMLLTAQNRFEEAQETLERVVMEREELRGLEDPSVVHALEALAAMQLTAGLEDEASGTIARVLRIASKAKTGDWKRAAEIVGEYQRGVHDIGVGDFARAAERMESAIQSVTEILGPEHPFAAVMRFDYARALEAQGDHRRAAAILEDSVARGQSLVSPNHPLLLFGRLNLALAYMNDGQLDKAETLLDAMTPDVTKTFGVESWQYGDHLAMMSLVKFAKGETAEAAELVKQGLSLAETTERPSDKIRDPLRADMWRRVADDLLAAGDLDSADRAVKEGGTAFAAGAGAGDWPERFQILRARILARQGKQQEAAQLLKSARDAIVDRPGFHEQAAAEADAAGREIASPPASASDEAH